MPALPVDGEAAAIDRERPPQTVESLLVQLRELGVQPGITLLVHCSLRSIGWVNGGPVAVILALERAVGESGTLVMPAHSGGLSDPAGWHNPAVPESWWETVRETMPAFVPGLTPTRGMGIVAETFRKQEGVLRSNHPTVSFCARGPASATITGGHLLEFSLGEGSPLARLYELDGSVLLLGVGHASNTSLHLAEYRATYPGRQVVREGSPVTENGERRWVTYEDINLDSGDFALLGADFDGSLGKPPGRIGRAESRLIRQRDLVDYGADWITRNRVAGRPA